MILLERLYLLSTLLIAFFGVISIKRYSFVFKLLIVLIAVSFVIEICDENFILKRHNNLPLYHLYGIVEYLFLTVIYSKILQGVISKIVLALMIPMFLLALVNSFFLQQVNNFPSNFLLISEIFYISYAFLGFRQMLMHPVLIPLHNQSLFWLNLGQIIFSTTLLINFGLASYLDKLHINQNPLFMLNGVVNLIYLVLLSVAIIKDGTIIKYSKAVEK